MRIIENGELAEMNVRHTTNVHNLAVSLSKTLQNEKNPKGGPMRVRLVAIGANAVNQMVKAAAKSRSMLAPHGIDIAWKAFFIDRPGEAQLGQTPDQVPEKVSAVCVESVRV